MRSVMNQILLWAKLLGKTGKERKNETKKERKKENSARCDNPVEKRQLIQAHKGGMNEIDVRRRLEMLFAEMTKT